MALLWRLPLTRLAHIVQTMSKYNIYKNLFKKSLLQLMKCIYTYNFLVHIGSSPKALYASFKEIIQKLKGDCPVFGVLVVGETGTGKSALVNNLMGRAVVEEGDTLDSQTATITKHTLEVQGVTVALYDTPGLDDTRGTEDDAYLGKMKDILKGDTITGDLLFKVVRN